MRVLGQGWRYGGQDLGEAQARNGIQGQECKRMEFGCQSKRKAVGSRMNEGDGDSCSGKEQNQKGRAQCKRGAAALLPGGMASFPKSSHLGFRVSSLTPPLGPVPHASGSVLTPPLRRLRGRRIDNGDEHRLGI